MKKYRLKRWVKVVIGVLAIGYFTILFIATSNNYSIIAKKCDSQKGYSCSYYEIERMMKNN